MAQAKVYTIIKTHRGREMEFTGPIEELPQRCRSQLECGHSWEYQKGCKKVNTAPKTIKQLLTALANAVYNTQGGCFEQDHYALKEV